MFKNFDHIKIASYLVYFLVPAIVTGPFLSDLSLSIIALYFLIIFIVYKPYEIVPKEFTYLFFLSFFYIVLRSIFSEFSYNSLTYDGVVFYFRYYFFCLGIVYLSVNNPNLIKNIVFVSLITTLVVISDGVLQLVTGKNILGWDILYRVSGLFKDELVIGIFLSKIILLIFTFYDLTYPNKYKKIRYFCLLLGLIFLIYTRERAALVLFLSYFLFYLAFIENYNFTKKLTIVSLVILIILITLLLSEQVLSYLLVTISQINDGYIPLLPYPKGYEGIILSAINIFKENNIIFGSGANTFRNLCIEHSFKNFCTSHPHNYYVQNLIDLGIFGLILMIGLYVKGIIYFFMIDKKNKLLRSFILIGLIHFFPLIPSMNFYNNWTNVIIYLPIAISLYYWYESKKL